MLSCVYVSPLEKQELKDAHVLIHLVECAVGLLEEVEDNAFAEISLIFIVVHLEDLLEGCDINVVAKIGESDGTVLILLINTHISLKDRLVDGHCWHVP